MIFSFKHIGHVDVDVDLAVGFLRPTIRPLAQREVILQTLGKKMNRELGVEHNNLKELHDDPICGKRRATRLLIFKDESRTWQYPVGVSGSISHLKNLEH